VLCAAVGMTLLGSERKAADFIQLES